MQSKTTRGVRHLLVSTGVISLVLSVAAPALADRPDDLPEPGSQHVVNPGVGVTQVDICHNGHVITVDDDGELGGHAKHNDWKISDRSPEECGKSAGDTLEDEELVQVCVVGTLVEIPGSELTGDETLPSVLDGLQTCAGEAIIDGGELVKVCRTGGLVEVEASDVVAGDVAPVLVEGEDPTCTVEIVVDGEKVEVCHEGTVIEIAAEALEDHLGHGDAEMAEATSCPAVIVKDKDKEIDDSVVVLDDPEVVVEVPVKNPPAAPVQPIPAPQPRPIVTISADTVAKPVVATPAATPKAENEVLGAITTRTPTPGVGALDPGVHTAASITALAATGADGTKVLAVAGALLLLSGFGLQVSGRRRLRSAVVEA